jgi:hypothetical protein
MTNKAKSPALLGINNKLFVIKFLKPNDKRGEEVIFAPSSFKAKHLFKVGNVGCRIVNVSKFSVRWDGK